jgi:benzodiazapine receptor
MEPRVDWFAGFAIAATLLFPIGSNAVRSETRAKYNDMRERLSIPIMPPGWVFGPVWFVLYLLMTVAIVLWSAVPEPEQHGAMFVWTWIMFIVNVFFNKIWQPLFFDANGGRGWPVVAAVDAWLIMLTGVTVLVLFCLAPTLSTVAIVFWSVYVAWSLYAAILSTWIAVRNRGFIEVSVQD